MSLVARSSLALMIVAALAPAAMAEYRDREPQRVPTTGKSTVLGKHRWTKMQLVPLQAPAAPVQVSCTFLEVAASKNTKSMDPGLKVIEKKLTRGPFKTWSEFKLLSTTTKTLAKKKTEAITLKQGAATGTLVEVVDKSKARLTLTVDNAKGKRVVDTTLTVDAADYVIVTNELPNGDGHLVAVTCK